MGSSVSLPPLVVGSDASRPETLQRIYEDFMEDDSLRKPFTSSLFDHDPSTVQQPFEWPDDNFIVDIVTNPSVLTECKTPREALQKIVFPLFSGPDSTKPYVHQILLQFFEFGKAEYKDYHKKCQARTDSVTATSKTDQEVICSKHSQQSEPPQTEVKLETIDNALKFLKKERIFSGSPALKTFAEKLEIVDVKSAYFSIVAGLCCGDCSMMLAALPFLWHNGKAKWTYKFKHCSEWFARLSLENVCFVPFVNDKTKMNELTPHPVKNVTIAANGRYVYVSDATGTISVMLRDSVLQKVKVSKNDVVCAASNGMVFLTDFEKDYVYRAYPFEKLGELPRGKITWPFCSDGYYLYSLSQSGKKIHVAIIESPKTVRIVRTVELLPLERKGPILAEGTMKPCMMYCNGSVATLMKLKASADDGYEYILRHYSVMNGQHIGDFQFMSKMPIGSLTFDPFNRCFYGISLFESSTQILEFPYYGSVPHWLSGFDVGDVGSSYAICKKFESAKTAKDVSSAVVEFFRYFAAHASGFTFEQLLVNHLYTPVFGNFLCPLSEHLFGTVLNIIEQHASDNDVTMIMLAILQINMANFIFFTDDVIIQNKRLLKLFDLVLVNEKWKSFRRAAIYSAMSAYTTVFRDCWINGQTMFAQIFNRSSDPFKLLLVKQLARKRRLAFCFSSELCRTTFTNVFDKFVLKEPVSILEMELVDTFQHHMMRGISALCYEFTGKVPPDRLNFRKTYEIYTELIFTKFLEQLTRTGKVDGPLSRVFSKYIFMLKPVVKYSVMAQKVLPHLFGVFSKLYGLVKGQAMSDGRALSWSYNIFFQVLYLYASCIKSILKGGREIKEAEKFTLMDEHMERDKSTFFRLKRIKESITNSTVTRELLGELSGVTPAQIDFVESAISEDSENSESSAKLLLLFQKTQSDPVKVKLGMRLTPLERRIERVVLMVLVKQEKCFDDLIAFIESGEISEPLAKIARTVGTLRLRLRNLIQNCEDVEKFEHEFIQKAQFLLFLDISANNLTRVSSFLTSEFSLSEIFYFLEEADRVKGHVQCGYDGITQMMKLDKSYGVFLITFMVKTHFCNPFFTLVHKDGKGDLKFKQILEEMLDVSPPIVVFYSIILLTFDSFEHFSPALHILREKKLAKSTFVLIISVLYVKLFDLKQKGVMPETVVKTIEEFLHENKNGFTFQDVPILRLCLRSEIPVPLSFHDLLRLFKESNETYMHSITELLADVIEKSDQKPSLFKWILRELGTIAMGKKGFFYDFSEDLQMSICDELVELCRKFVRAEPLHEMFVKILSKADSEMEDPAFLYSVFVVLSESLDTFHSHFLMSDTVNNTTNYITDMSANGQLIKFYTLPFKPYAVRKEQLNTKRLVPISEYPFGVNVFEEKELLIPYFIEALKVTDSSLLRYYQLQSLKAFIESPDFLHAFLDAQPVLVIKNFSFVDFSLQFLNVVKFQLKHPLFDSPHMFYCLDSEDGSIEVTSEKISTTSGSHLLYSPLISGCETISLDNLSIQGKVRVGVLSLSLFHYSTSHYEYDHETNCVFHNDEAITTLSEPLTRLAYDPQTRELTFNSTSITVEEGTFCFVVHTQDEASVTFAINGGFGTCHEFLSSMPFHTLAQEKENVLFKYPPELIEAIPDSFDVKFVCDRKPIMFESFKGEKAVNLETSSILTPFKNCRACSQVNEYYIYQILGSIQIEIHTRILMNSIIHAPNIDYMWEQFDMTPEQLVDFATALLTLIEPLQLDKNLLNFSFNRFTDKSPTKAFQCVEKILGFFDNRTLIELWFNILRKKMNTVTFHFIDIHNPNVIVLSVSSLTERKRIVIDDARGFLVFKGGFSQQLPQLAVVNDGLPLQCNITYVNGSAIELVSCPNAPNSNCIVCVPLYSRPNTSLFDSFMELAVTFKYFVLFLTKHKDCLSFDEFRMYKVQVYQFFFDAFNFESPFFFTYARDIQDFLAANMLLTPVDLDQEMGKKLSLLGIYSGDKPHILSFLKKMQTVWNEKALIPLMCQFPEFVAEQDRISPSSCSCNSDVVIPASPFPTELKVGEDYTQLIQILKSILLHHEVIGFPFHYLLSLWAQMASKYPPFEFTVIDKRTIEVHFTLYTPENYEFRFAKKGITFTNREGFVFSSNVDITDDIKFFIVSQDRIKPDKFLFEHKSEFISDMVLFVENWDSNDDRRILKKFTSLDSNRLVLDITPAPFLSSKLSPPYHRHTVRATLLVTINWMFANRILNPDSRVCIRLFDYISRDMRISMFLKLVQEKSTCQPASVVVNRMMAYENRNGTRPQFSNSLVAQVMRQYKSPPMFRTNWKVTWEGELGEDGGGPGRELLTETAVDILSFNTGLFVEFGKDVFIPACSSQLENPSQMYHIVGVIMGMIIRSGCVQNFPFPNFFWRFMCSGELFIDDIFSIDPSYRDEIECLGTIGEDEFNRMFPDKTFSVTDFKGKHVQMKDGIVTYDLVQSYISMANQFKLSLLQPHLENIRAGLLENLDVKELPMYVTPDLLEFCVCGAPQISAKALMKVVAYREVTSDVKKLFARIVSELSSEQRALLLRFVTGRIRLPRLEEGKTLFTVDMATGLDDRLPRASTCFNQLQLPKYSSFEVAKRQMIIAIENTASFENR